MSKRRIGLLGGSFNPAHGGHRIISEWAQQAAGLNEVWWLVSPGNPLKSGKDMAPLAARVAHARHVARRSRIQVSAIERDLHTRYTIDTLRKLVRRYPRHQFLWLMGGDNLMQFGRWKDWRGIARLMPIAVIERPGYNHRAHGSPVMSWLRRFVRPACQSNHWTDWRPPALVLLRFRPDPRSATLLRQADPLWHCEYEGRPVRDMVTRRLILDEISLSAAQVKERH